MSEKLYFLISFVLLLGLVTNASAYDTVIWDNNSGAGDRLWDTAMNWWIDAKPSPRHEVPIAGDWAIIDETYTDDGNGPIIDGNTDANCMWVTIGWYALPAGRDAVLTMTGGTLAVGDYIALNNGRAGTARFDVSGGIVDNVGTFYVGYDVGGTHSTVNMNGGTMNIGGMLQLGIWGDGTFNMTAGDVNVVDWFDIGGYYTAGSTPGDGHLDLQGGTIECILLAMGGGGVGTMNVAGGTLIIDGDYRGPNGWLFDPENDTPSDEYGVYTGTIAILADRGLITAYGTNVGDIITDGNYPVKVGLRAVINLDYDVTNPGQTTITAGAVDPNLAWDPDPLNGSGGLVATDINLISWAAGDNAASHEVYFGTSFAEVNDADTSSGAHKATQSLADVNYPVSVTWGRSYYWRIDEVNGASTWKGTVWNFGTAPAWATEPSPEDGDPNVSPTSAVLSWTPGAEAVTHQVYLSSDFNDVNDRDPNVRTVVSDPCHPAGALELDTTYYWAVDEVNNLADPNVWPGQIWEFTTLDYLSVDNFDSYLNNPELYAVWDDGYINSSGALIFVETLPEFTRDGNSLMFQYNGIDKKLGSFIDADTADLEVGSDWTHGGVKALQMVFMGQAGNSATANDKMWVELEDTSSITGIVIYDGDPNDVKEDIWHEWAIDLGSFDACGVTLSNVGKISIGFGGAKAGQSTKSGTGTVYFDSVELVAPYCRTEMVATDITGDCVTDNWDLQIMGRDWLVYDYNFIAAEPCDANLIGWWKFDEGTGATTVDSSSNNNDGNIIEASWTTGHPNDPCDSALDFDGDGFATFDTVVCAVREGNTPGTYPAVLMPANFTISCWTNLDSFDYFGAFVTNGIDSGGDECGFFLFNDGYDGDENFGLAIRTENEADIVYYVETASIYETKTWYHLAATYDGNYASVYVDGQLAAGPMDVGGPIRWISDVSGNLPENFVIGAWLDVGYELYVEGVIDEVRYYDYALPQGEIAVLAGIVTAGESVYQPVPSLANLTDPEAPLLRKVNFNDYGIFADHWLEGPVLWPSP